MSKWQHTIRLTHWLAARRLPVPIVCEFSFDPADPLAVSVTFRTGRQYPPRWVFARELLCEGFTARSGQGDVQIWPEYDQEGGCSLWIQVGNASGTALFEAPARPVAEWLAHSYAMVPRGRELAHVNWDALAQAFQ
ncbi:SsgA family sporulation/cell division regulator [Streptomyces sp. NPDC018347]|uniref:SsgA family sporulation/cell division regulator n=1 Tax=Streptomyces sp. NPDC018347 TaxID=3157193 RepID=UPI003407F2F6